LSIVFEELDRLEFELFESKGVKEPFTLIDIFKFLNPIIGFDRGELEYVSNKNYLLIPKACLVYPEVKGHQNIDAIYNIGAKHTDFINNHERSLFKEFNFFFIEFKFFVFAILDKINQVFEIDLLYS